MREKKTKSIVLWCLAGIGLSRCTVVDQPAVILTANQVRVEQEDTLEMIAYRYQVSPRELADINGLMAPFRLQRGQILVLPRRQSSEYRAPVVEEGPTLVKEPERFQEEPEEASTAETESTVGRYEEDNPVEKVLTVPVKPMPEEKTFQGVRGGAGLRVPVPVVRAVEDKNHSLLLTTKAGATVRSPIRGTIEYVGAGVKNMKHQMILIQLEEEDIQGKAKSGQTVIAVLGPLATVSDSLVRGKKVKAGEVLGTVATDNGKNILCCELWDWKARSVLNSKPFWSPELRAHFQKKIVAKPGQAKPHRS